MACWDGMFPLFWGMNDPAERLESLRQWVTTVQTMRQELLPDAAQRPFDVVTVGETPAGQPAQTAETTASFADAGATWWLESLAPDRGGGQPWSFEQLRERVLAGPLG